MKLFSIFFLALAAVTTVTAVPVDDDSASIGEVVTPAAPGADNPAQGELALKIGDGRCSARLKWTTFCEGGYAKSKVLVTDYEDEHGHKISEPGERLVGPDTNTHLWAVQGGRHEFWIDGWKGKRDGRLITTLVFDWMNCRWDSDNSKHETCGVTNLISKDGDAHIDCRPIRSRSSSVSIAMSSRGCHVC
jgi:hypothetical protein